jgi:hypothetical protein
MSPIFLLLLFPLIWPFIAKRIWNTKITWTEMVLNIVVVVIICTATYELGKWGKTKDTEIWNGVVTAKTVKDGEYVTSYECNCYETCYGSGSERTCSQTCSTCYEDNYTRSYDGYTTVGNFEFDSIDTTSRSKRNSFQPPLTYTKCVVGEPASREHEYTNYVQAVPTSLFNDNSKLSEQYVDKIPQYPQVFGFYKINRVLNVGSSVPTDVKSELNTKLNHSLISLGQTKQSNIIVIFTNIADPSYRYAIENAWLGGKKNDIVIIIGTQDGKTVQWVDVMTWALNTGNELLHVKMRDGIKSLPIDATQLSKFIEETTQKHFVRPQMADYKYLEKEVKPATWVVSLAFFLSIFGSMALTFLFHRIDIDFFRKKRYNRY